MRINGEKNVISTNEHDSDSLEPRAARFRDQRAMHDDFAQGDGSYQGYLAALVEAWKAADALARRQIADGQPPTALGDCIRYALIHTTLVGNLDHRADVAGSDTPIPDAPPAPALETILTIQDPKARADALIAQIERGTGEAQEAFIRAAVEAVLEIQEVFGAFPSDLWPRLRPYMLGTHFAQIATQIFESSNEGARTEFTRCVAHELDRDLMKRALRSAFGMRDPEARAYSLREFVQRVRGQQRLRIAQALYRDALEIGEFPSWGHLILAESVRWLRGPQRVYAIEKAVAVVPKLSKMYRTRAASTLIPYLSKSQRAVLLKNLLNVRHPGMWLEACAAHWPYLPTRRRRLAIPMTLQVRDRRERARYLAQIAWRLRAGAYREAVQHIANAILDIRNERERETVLAEVRRYVQDQAIEQAAATPVKHFTPNAEALLGYRFTFAQRDPQYVACALANLAPHMDDAHKTRALPLMVDLALSIDLEDYMAEAIEWIAPALDAEYLGKALEGALQIGRDWFRVWALSGLAPYLAGAQRERCVREALEASGFLDAERTFESWADVDMAVRLLPSLTGKMRADILAKGLTAAQMAICDLSDARTDILPYVDGADRAALAMAILRDLPRFINDSDQAHAFDRIAAYLPADEVGGAIEATQVIQDRYAREFALAALIPRLQDIETALASAQALETPYARSRALIALLPRLAGEPRSRALERAMATIDTIPVPDYRLERWADLLPLVEDQRPIRVKVVETLLDCLWANKDRRRNHILALCADKRAVSADTLSLEVLRAIGTHVTQICMEWAW